MPAGFNLTSRGWEERSNSLTFTCNRGKVHRGKSPKESPKNSPKDSPKAKKDVPGTWRPMRGEDDKCKFNFKTCWDAVKSRWCIPKKQAGDKRHCGHTHREPHECRAHSRHCGEDAMKDIVDTLQSSIRPTQVANFKTGHRPESSQLALLKKKSRDTTQVRVDVIEETANGNPCPDPDCCPTPADRPLSHLESNEKFSCMVLCGHFGSDELKVHHRVKQSGSKATTELENPQQLDGNDNAEKVDDCAAKVRERLSMTGSGSVLLAVAWTTDEAQRKFEIFPEFTCSDVTFCTNAERRPPMTFCGKDGDNKSFSHTRAFLPGQSRRTFDWFFSCASPALHRHSFILRNRIHTTDQGRQECGAFLASQIDVFMNSLHGLCAFNKINWNCLEGPEHKGAIAANNRDTSRDIELRMIVHWLNRFIRDCETQQEAELSERLSEEHLLNHTTLTSTLRTLTMDHFHNEFDSVKGSLCRHHFMDIPSFENCTSSVNESQNHACKWSAASPRAWDAIDESLERLMEVLETKQAKVQRKAAIEMNSKPSNAEQRETTLTDLTRHMSDGVMSESHQSPRHDVHCCRHSAAFEEAECHVRRQKIESDKQPACGEKKKMADSTRVGHRSSWCVPSFERTRVVRVFKENGCVTPLQWPPVPARTGSAMSAAADMPPHSTQADCTPTLGKKDGRIGDRRS